MLVSGRVCSKTAMHSLSLAPVWLLTARHAVEKSLSDVVESKPHDWEERITVITVALHKQCEPEQYTYLQDKQKPDLITLYHYAKN